MKNNLFLGVDIGTTLVKATIIDVLGNTIASKKKNHQGIKPKPGWHEHNPDIHWWGSFRELVKCLSSQIGDLAPNISSIALSGIFPTFCPADIKGKPLYNAILYDDSRSSELAHAMKHDFGPTLYGNELIPRILWFRENHPDLWESTQMIFSSHSYVVYKLTGTYCVDSLNAFVSGNVFDNVSGNWKKGLFSSYDIPTDILPSVYPPSKIAGYLDPDVANELGLKSGIPVTTGTGDTPLSILGAGAYKKGDVLLNYGSVGVMVRLTQDIEYMLNTQVYSDGDSGFVNLLVLNQFGKQLEALASLLMGTYFSGESVDLSVFDNVASKVHPNTESIIFRRCSHGHEQDSIMTTNPIFDIVGLTIETTPAEIYRAILECLGFEVRHAFDLLGGSPEYLCASGGGAKSRIWREIVTNITKLPEYFIKESIGAYGNALLAGYAVNEVDLSKTLQNQLSQSEITTPNISTFPAYDYLYTKYLS